MALYFKGNIFKTGTDVFKLCSTLVRSKSDFNEKAFNEIQTSRNEEDMPVEMENPFVREKPQCILCKMKIEPDFRNVRLLSQFMSSYTGRVYGRHITGLCERKHKLLQKEIMKAQVSGLLGHYVKDPNFLADPELYDSSKPFRYL